MPPSKFKADYSALADIAKSFGSEANHSRQSISNLKSKLEELKGGGWKGDAANKFYAEMDGAVLPAYTRLSNALETAQQVTTKIRALAKQTEDTSSKIFIIIISPTGGLDGGGGSGGPGGADGATGGTGGQGGNGAKGGGGGSGGASGGPPSWFKGKGKLSSKAFNIKYGVAKGAVFGDAKAADGVSAIGGEAGVELTVEGLKKGKVGIFAEGYLAKAQGDTIFAGDKDLGFTGAGEVKVGGVSGFAGIKDGSVGASIGGSIITAKGELGANISGYNVGVNAEVGLKAELGFKIGKKTEIKLPFVTLGFSFGGARS